MNVQEAAKLLVYLRACYPNATVTESMSAVWAEQFADIAFPLVKAAADRHMREGNKFFPSVPELHTILHAEELVSDEEAFTTLLAEIRSTGYYREPSLEPFIAATVASLGGWRVVCASELDELRRNFLRAYPNIRDRLERQRAMDRAALASTHVIMIGHGDEDV